MQPASSLLEDAIPTPQDLGLEMLIKGTLKLIAPLVYKFMLPEIAGSMDT